MTTRAFTGVLGVEPTRDLEAVTRALQSYPETFQRKFFDASSRQLTTAWTDELSKRSGYSALQKRIVADLPIARAYRGGLIAQTGGEGKLGDFTREYEFGTLRHEDYVTYLRRGWKSGIRTLVRRRTKRQLPTRSQTGWIAYPAAGRWSVRVFKMVMDLLVKVGHDAVEGRRG